MRRVLTPEASESVIASALSAVFAGTPIIFNPIQFRMEFWIENDEVAGFFDYLLNLASSRPKICLTRKYTSCTAG
jgi:hypothetical protein